MSVFEKDKDGNVIDPPVLPEHEARLAAAANSGDDAAVQRAQEDYNKARNKEVQRIEADAKKGD